MRTFHFHHKPIILLLIAIIPVFTLSQTNQHLHFDGSDDYARLDNGSQYIANSADGMTITGWFNADDLGGARGLIGYRNGTSDGGFWMSQNTDGTIKCRFVGTNGLFEYVAPPNTIIPTVWTHCTWVYDGSSELSLYINGQLNGSVPASGTLTNPNIPFTIGRSILGNYNFYFYGRVDEASVWNKALSQSEIQDLIDNELTGNENNLQLYYKFNQGVPGGNNTSITHLLCEVGNGERDAELLNFALIGETSNFLGDMNPGFQAISFPQIPNHLVSDPPFELEATATSGLIVQYEVLSGPATVDGNICTLLGDTGLVIIQATQPGDTFYTPAVPVINSFMVLDPALTLPNIDPRNPLNGEVFVPELGYIQLASIVTIEYPDLFSVSSVQFNINGQTLTATDWGDGYYSGWWLVPEYGNYTLTISAANNYGVTATETVNIEIVSEVENMVVQAADNVWLNTSIGSVVVDAELPSYLGAFDEIIATLEVSCPPGGCGEWDRIASIDARGHNGEWVEIIRYITPYGTPCSHTIDLADYMSVLQGKVSFRLNCGTLDNGYYYDLTFNFNEGAPAYNYSNIDIVWWDNYQFGDYSNLQPVEDLIFSFPDNTQASTLKLVSTGHGWGDLNTGNAAEFYEATHHIYVNDEETFEQYNWYDCNPNPDGCQPQNGTWFYNRAGWCPGAIAQWFDYDLTQYVGDENIELGYVFYEDYVDYCHPNHPDCITGVTCDNCSAGFNPFLVVACNLVVFSDTPIDSGAMVSVDEIVYDAAKYIMLYPNPSRGMMTLEFIGKQGFDKAIVEIGDLTGNLAECFEWYGETRTINLSGLSAGVYFVKIKTENMLEVRMIVLH